MISLQEAARLLGGEVSGGQIRCPAPAHTAQDPSLSVRLSPNAPDGFVANSFDGDNPMECRDHVREKLGMPAFKPNGNGRARPQRKVVAEYIYRTADGSPYLRVLRTDNKDFWQQHWDGAQWVKGKPDGGKIPYRLPEMLAAETVYIVEGEKDADRLAKCGYVATTCSEGAGKWRPELNEYFRNKHVVVLPDNDGPGHAHAQQVATNLHGIAASIRVVTLPGLADKGDVSDWLDDGNLRENIE